VLETAHREITENTSLYFAWEPIRKGLRKVVAVRFVFDLERAGILTEGRTQEQENLAELDRISELQRLSNQCFERLKKLRRSCDKPKKSEKCNYCTTRGRMYAVKVLKEAQGRIPFEEIEIPAGD
jgi:plasmid replication initiation protein